MGPQILKQFIKNLTDPRYNHDYENGAYAMIKCPCHCVIIKLNRVGVVIT